MLVFKDARGSLAVGFISGVLVETLYMLHNNTVLVLLFILSMI